MSVLHIYTRVSTQVQADDGSSLDTQLELGVQCAERLGFEYVHWDERAASSAGDDLAGRPVLASLLSKIDEGQVQHVFVFNEDRLSRNVSTWGLIRLKLVQHDVVLHTPTGQKMLSDPQTALLVGILSEISQYDNSLRRERSRLGKLQAIQGGGWRGGPPPFGYEVIKKKLVVNEHEMQWVRSMYEWYKSGSSVRDIRDKLMQEGVFTRRKKVVWSDRSIQLVLQNRLYTGEYTYTDKSSGQTFTLSCPAGVSTTLYDDVQKRFESRRAQRGSTPKKSSSAHTFVLNDVLFCGECGAAMRGRMQTSDRGSYRCNSQLKRHRKRPTIECHNRFVEVSEIDQLVWDNVVEVLGSSEVLKAAAQEAVGGSVKRLTAKQKKSLVRRLDGIQADIDRTTSTIASFEVSQLVGERDADEIAAILDGLSAHRTSLKRDSEAIQTQLDNDGLARESDSWVKAYKGFTSDMVRLGDAGRDDPAQRAGVGTFNEVRQMVVRTFVDKVTATANHETKMHEIVIDYKMPASDEVLSMQQSLGLKIKKSRRG